MFLKKIVVNIFLLSLICLTMNACASSPKETEIFLFPEGYIGSFHLVFNVPNGYPPEYDENGARIYRFDETGVYHSQLNDAAGYHYDGSYQMYYLDKKGNRQPIPLSSETRIDDTATGRSDSTIYAFSLSNGTHGHFIKSLQDFCDYDSETYYLGTYSNGLDGINEKGLSDYYDQYSHPCEPNWNKPSP